jgi:hypothetical protein
MGFDSSYQQILSEIAQLNIFSGGSLSISEIEDLDLIDYYFYKEIYKNHYEQEQNNKQELIKQSFEFAKKSVEIICKSIGGLGGSGKKS